ncbi:hypothetical protein X474_15610 [Dethiosulfatarculus sandiegensis]|uniref:Uncharacterized protein n=1 Tax=Dethiosulfatarculus sandiegensis TaxID=1429043 RepID=A0A0D2JUH7_9BACT|nr:hypothetical protein X474_15610 [Dethiosulfatarculus sandiegensis]
MEKGDHGASFREPKKEKTMTTSSFGSMGQIIIITEKTSL